MKDITKVTILPANSIANTNGNAAIAPNETTYTREKAIVIVTKMKEFLHERLILLSILSSVPVPPKALRNPKNPKNP